MSTSVEFMTVLSPLTGTPLDEAVRLAWIEKREAQGRRNAAIRTRIVKAISVVALIVGAVFLPRFVLMDVLVRFILTAGAMVAMFHAFQARKLAIAAVFGALAVLYNPVAPMFSFSGDWHRLVAVACAVPFAVAFAWPNKRSTQ